METSTRLLAESAKRMTRRLRPVGFALMLTALVASFTIALASHVDDVVDMTYAGASELHNGAVIIQGGAGAGTGNWDPFLTASANTPTEAGLNSIKPLKQFNSFYGGSRTHPLLASAVPSILYDSDNDGQPELWREFGLDANDQGADTWMSIDVLKVFLTDTGAVQYDPATENFTTGNKIGKIYDLGGAPILMVSQGLESGSGVSDISVLLPDGDFPCAYGDLDCDVWVVMYTEYGSFDPNPGIPIGEEDENDAADFDWDVSAGFEEWRTQLLPVVNVQKTAEVTYTRTHNWDLTKDESGEYYAFIGEQWSHDYSVFADHEGFTDSDRLITGEIIITNPTGGDIISDSIPAVITQLPWDEVNLGDGDEVGAATVTCPVSFPYTLDAGEELVCTYEYEPGITENGINTAFVEIEINDDGDTRVYEGEDDVIFGDPTTEVDESVDVDDTNSEFGGPYTTGVDLLIDYSVDFDCPTDQSLYASGQYDYSHLNTATLIGEVVDLSDSETVIVHCYLPSISKSAAGTYDERHEWEVDKSVDPESQSAFIGDTVTFDWTIMVDEEVFEENFDATGSITVINPNPQDELVVPLADELSDGTVASISGCNIAGGVLTVAASGSEVCSFSALDLPYDDEALAPDNNTASIVLNAITFSDDDAIEWTANVIRGSATLDDDQFPYSNEPVSDGWTSTYEDSYTCSSDVSDYTDGQNLDNLVQNTAEVYSEGALQDSSTAITEIDCFAPVLSKDASASYDERHTWDIEKSVDPTSQSAFAGEGVSWTWMVTLSESFVEENFAVSGGIDVENPSGSPGNMTVSLVDQLNDGTFATVDCGSGATSVEVAPGATETCSYSAAPTGRTATLNTATGSFNSIDFIATAGVSFVKNVINGTAYVDDDQEPAFPTTVNAGQGPWEWSETEQDACSSDASWYAGDGTYSFDDNNTATVTGSDGQYDEDSASTTVDCYAPIVDKDAYTEWFREFTWTIDKEYDGEYDLNLGESVDHDYLVSVDQTVDEYGYRAYGSISVSNPTGSPGNMTVDVADAVNGNIVTVDCDGFGGTSLTVAPGATESCDYTVDLGGTTSLVNTATVTFNEIDFQATADVIFGAPTIEGYPTINVTDTNGEAWSASADDSWAYIRTFDCPTDLSLYSNNVYEYIHVNVATIVETGDWADATVTVTCHIPFEGLTPGYWKNHLEDWAATGYAPNQPVGSVFAEAVLYGLGGDTLLEALDYPGGDTLAEKAQILLRAGVAALLNAAHPNVDYPLSEAEVIAQVNAALASGDAETILDLAGELDMYNNLGADLGS